ncbi:MAG TPA: hypothetical protein VD948_01410, partial [Rhodothermales bacterium]|nr:hypothetical protein [Rhodothermales bacterium]
DETIRLGEGTFASWRMAAALDEAQLEFVGRRVRVPYFRRPADHVETMYLLVGPGFRADGPMLYTPDGHCAFQPYRRISAATTGQ